MTCRFLVIISLGLALSGVVASARAAGLAADEDTETASQAVRITPKDLMSAEGARKLALRIRAVAEDVCDGTNVLTRETRAFHACVRETVERTADRLHAPIVIRAVAELEK